MEIMFSEVYNYKKKFIEEDLLKSFFYPAVFKIEYHSNDQNILYLLYLLQISKWYWYWYW